MADIGGPESHAFEGDLENPPIGLGHGYLARDHGDVQEPVQTGRRDLVPLRVARTVGDKPQPVRGAAKCTQRVRHVVEQDVAPTTLPLVFIGRRTGESGVPALVECLPPALPPDGIGIREPAGRVLRTVPARTHVVEIAACIGAVERVGIEVGGRPDQDVAHGPHSRPPGGPAVVEQGCVEV